MAGKSTDTSKTSNSAQGSGSANDGVVMPQGGGAPKPLGLIDAVSEIQQFYIIERTGQDIPADFLSLRGTLTFVFIGMKSGFSEGVMFAFLIPVVLTLSSATLYAVSGIQTDWFFQFLLYIMAFAPVAFNTFLCTYISKYYIGNLTKKAIRCLLDGRSAALVFKGFLMSGVFYFLSRYLTPARIATMLEKAGDSTQGQYDIFNDKIYNLFLSFAEHLPNAVYITLCTAIAGAALPSVVVYWQDTARKKKLEAALRALEEA